MMTDKMRNTLAHILNAYDVDDWAKKEVEHIFTSYDAALFLIRSVRDNVNKSGGDMSQGMYDGLSLAVGILEEGMLR